MMPLHVHNQHVPGHVKFELDELVIDRGNWDDIADGITRQVECAQRRERHDRARRFGRPR